MNFLGKLSAVCLSIIIFSSKFCTGQVDSGSQQIPRCIHDVPTPVYFEDDSYFRNCFEEVAQNRFKRHPDEDKRVNQIILAYGYDLVTYDNVTTEDGYILTVFRISGSKSSPPKKGKPAILLFHGMGSASDQWVLQHGDRNLAFKLADAGYDVFLANARGTDFSQRHVKLTANDIAFWDFGFHEIGIYDFPSIVSLMLTETGKEKIFFCGHSMGATVLAVGLAEKPELNKKIEASFLLGPAIFIGHLYGPHRILAPILELPQQLQGLLMRAMRGRVDSGLPAGGMLSPARVCTPTALRCGVCGNVIFYMYGYDAPQMNYTNVPNILSKISNSFSFKMLLHFGQNFRSCMFRKYDYGTRGNLIKYGQSQPASYNVSEITAPTYIYYGDADNFVPPVDAAITRDALPPRTVKGFFRVNWKFFNHVDFAMAKDADSLVYNSILDILNKYTQNN